MINETSVMTGIERICTLAEQAVSREISENSFPKENGWKRTKVRVTK